MIAIQGTYAKITTVFAASNDYQINPFDLYGNLLTEMTIEVDSTLDIGTIYLPEISSLNNNWNIKINIIALTGSTNNIFIYRANLSVDQIGSQFSIILNADGKNVELSPVSATNWAANITI